MVSLADTARVVGAALDRAAQRRERMALAVILVVAFALRVGAGLALPSIVHPDEIFQVVEAAHRIVYGTGIVPWEYIVGIRSWLFPGVVSGVMAAARLLDDDPKFQLDAIAVAMSAASLAIVACGFLWGLRMGRLLGAVIVGALLAVWVDLVYFAPHPLTEVIAGDCLVVALYLVYPARPQESRARLFAAGVLFGLTFVFRFHLAPAIAVAGLWAGGRDLRGRWLPLLAGGLVPVLISGLLDAVTWTYPFQTVWLNFWVNVVLKASEFWGTTPWYELARQLVQNWGGATAVIALVALWGGRRLPLLLAVAAAILATHSLIAHKEYRFIYPALPLILTLAGVATAELIETLWRSARRRPPLWVAGAVAIGFWTLTSACVAIGVPERSLWLQRRGEIAAFDLLSSDDAACGIGIYGVDIWLTPGYSDLRRPLPFYDVKPEDLSTRAPAFNRLLAYGGTAVPDGGFGQPRCFDDGFEHNGEPRPPVCVWRRAGGCLPDGRTGPATLWPPQLRGRWPAPPG